MPTPTYTQIFSTTIASPISNIRVSNIPQNYKDLVLVLNGNGTTGDRYGFEILLNGDTTFSNYSRSRFAYESSLFSDSSSSPVIAVMATEISSQILNFLDYSATDKHKSIMLRGNTVGASSSTYTYVDLSIGRWANTAAVTSITLQEVGGASNIAAGMTFTLYGIVG